MGVTLIVKATYTTYIDSWFKTREEADAWLSHISDEKYMFADIMQQELDFAKRADEIEVTLDKVEEDEE